MQYTHSHYIIFFTSNNILEPDVVYLRILVTRAQTIVLFYIIELNANREKNRPNKLEKERERERTQYIKNSQKILFSFHFFSHMRINAVTHKLL